MVATCHHLSVDIDTVAHTVAASPAAVDWWGSAADAAFAAIRNLSRDVAATATAVDALRHVFAAYGAAVWPPSGVPVSAFRLSSAPIPAVSWLRKPAMQTRPCEPASPSGPHPTMP
jgi:hypothetical protein